MVDLVTNDYRDVLSELRIAAAIDYKYEGGIVVWSDGVDGEILRATFESNVSTSLVARGSKKFGSVGGLAVDWIHDKIYWTDTGEPTVWNSARIPRVYTNNGEDETTRPNGKI